MNRREFLKAAGLVGGAALAGGPTLLRSGDFWSPAHAAAGVAEPFIPPDSVACPCSAGQKSEQTKPAAAPPSVISSGMM